ncbi:hypothetical protein V6N13_045434 [Hibiscus sabdariffa]
MVGAVVQNHYENVLVRVGSRSTSQQGKPIATRFLHYVITLASSLFQSSPSHPHVTKLTHSTRQALRLCQVSRVLAGRQGQFRLSIPIPP